MNKFQKIAEAIVEVLKENDARPVEFHIDVESTSLRGEGFAFGGLVRFKGELGFHEFSAMSRAGASRASEWVQENVLPHLGDLSVVATQDDLYEAFWAIYAATRQAVIDAYGCQSWELAGKFIVIFDNGWPVESSFFNAAHDWAMANVGASEFDGPYMPVDVSSVLSAHGYDPDLPRHEAAVELGYISGEKHHPVCDAIESFTVYDAAMSGRLGDKYRV